MANNTEYKCSNCDKPTKRELLVVKKIHFLGIGVRAKTLKTRTQGWLCPDCLVRDPDWKKEAYDAPGLRPGERPTLHAS